jgi:autotransporter-associated beta strand protein
MSISFRRIPSVFGLLTAAVLACGMFVQPAAARAATITWTGGGTNASWSTTANWSNGTAPTTGDSLWFNNNIRTTGTNNISSLNIDTITFASPAVAFTLTGSAINLGSITNTSANNQTLSLSVIQSTSGTYNAGSNITLSGSLTGAGNIVKTGASSLVLSGNRQSGYTGLIDVTSGTMSFVSSASLAGGSLKLGANTTLASSVSTLNLKTLELAGAGITLPAGGISMSFNSGTFTNSSGGVYDIENTVSFINTSEIQVGAGLALNNALNGAGTLSKTGTGTLTLNSSSNAYGGTLNLNQGRLLLGGGLSSATINAAAGTEVATEASLTAFSVASLTFAAGAGSSNLTPGEAGGIGGFGSTSDILLSANTTTNFDIQGTAGAAGDPSVDYDVVAFALNGTGTLTYNGYLNLNFLGTNLFPEGTVFQLIDKSTSGLFVGDFLGVNNTTGSGSYSGLSFQTFASFTGDQQLFLTQRFGATTGDWISSWNGAGEQRLIFSQSSGTLTVVPEPSTIVFAGIGMAMFGWSTWTRRRAKSRRQVIEAAIA